MTTLDAMDTALDPAPTPDPTPEPVRWFSRVIAGAVILLTQLNPAANHFGWWHFDAVDLDYITQIAGAVGAFVILVAGAQVRDQVMPMKKVAAVVEQVKAEAATPVPLDFVHPDDVAMADARRAQREEADRALAAEGWVDSGAPPRPPTITAALPAEAQAYTPPA